MTFDLEPNWGQPFQNPDLYVADALRFFCIIAGCLMIGGVVAIAKKVRNTRQWGLYGFAVAGIVAIGTEWERLGKPVNWMLPFNLTFVMLGLIFCYKTYKGDRE